MIGLPVSGSSTNWVISQGFVLSFLGQLTSQSSYCVVSTSILPAAAGASWALATAANADKQTAVRQMADSRRALNISVSCLDSEIARILAQIGALRHQTPAHSS